MDAARARDASADALAVDALAADALAADALVADAAPADAAVPPGLTCAPDTLPDFDCADCALEGVVFVDAAAIEGDGSRARPFARIGSAVAALGAAGGVVYVAAGVYDETVELPDAVALVGAGDDPRAVTIRAAEPREGRAIALLARGIQRGACVRGITLTTPRGDTWPTDGAGISTYAVFAVDAPALTLSDVRLAVGAGGAGAPGTGVEMPGISGGDGGRALTDMADFCVDQIVGGEAGVNATCPVADGGAGADLFSGPSVAAAYRCPAGDGCVHTAGRSGLTGEASRFRLFDGLTPDGWVGVRGASGAPGEAGAGADGAALDDGGDAPHAAGGGAAGGCGGPGGAGGWPGGGSFNLYAVRSAGLRVDGVAFERSFNAGGPGGAGGSGGPGGAAGRSGAGLTCRLVPSGADDCDGGELGDCQAGRSARAAQAGGRGGVGGAGSRGPGLDVACVDGVIAGFEGVGATACCPADAVERCAAEGRALHPRGCDCEPADGCPDRPTQEACNGRDDDCDGVTDPTLAGEARLVSSAADHRQQDFDAEPLQIGWRGDHALVAWRLDSDLHIAWVDAAGRLLQRRTLDAGLRFGSLLGGAETPWLWLRGAQDELIALHADRRLLLEERVLTVGGRTWGNRGFSAVTRAGRALTLRQWDETGAPQGAMPQPPAEGPAKLGLDGGEFLLAVGEGDTIRLARLHRDGSPNGDPMRWPTAPGGVTAGPWVLAGTGFVLLAWQDADGLHATTGAAPVAIEGDAIVQATLARSAPSLVVARGAERVLIAFSAEGPRAPAVDLRGAWRVTPTGEGALALEIHGARVAVRPGLLCPPGGR